MHRVGDCTCGHCSLTGIEKVRAEEVRNRLGVGLANRECRPFAGELDESGTVRFHPYTFEEEVDNLRVGRLFMWGIGAVEGDVE